MLLLGWSEVREKIREYWRNLPELKEYANSRLSLGYSGPDYLRIWDEEYHLGYYPGSLVVYQFTQSPVDGWWNIIVYYDTNEFKADIYDEHVFRRYEERYLGTKGTDIHELAKVFLLEGGNYSGMYFIRPDNKFSRRTNQGATFGHSEYEKEIMFHKTFVPEELLDSRQTQGILKEGKYYTFFKNVNNRRKNFQS